MLLNKHAIKTSLCVLHGVTKPHNRYKSSNPLFYKYKCLKFSDLIEFKTSLLYSRPNIICCQKILRNYSNCVKKYNTRHSVKGNFEVKFCRTRARSI